LQHTLRKEKEVAMAPETKTIIETGQVVVMVDMPDMTAELYDAATRLQGLDKGLPEGCLVHIVGPGPEGWRVVSVWESREKLQQFAANTLRPVHAELGVAPPVKPPVLWELYDLEVRSGFVGKRYTASQEVEV
jgi:hypothetical protein